MRMQAQTNSSKSIGVTALLYLFVSLSLTSYTTQNPDFSRTVSSAASLQLQPVQQLFATLSSSVMGVWRDYVSLLNVVSENKKLKARLSALEREQSSLIEHRYENERLNQILEVKQQRELTGVIGSVIAHDPTRWTNSITIDVGTTDGVSPGLAVMNGKGVVGQVVSANPFSSRVLLLTDPTSGVDAIVQQGRVRGIIEGEGSALLRWKFVLSEAPLQVGARVITSGRDGVFPKGLLVGVVSDLTKTRGALFQKVMVKPSVDFGNLETVMVISGERVQNAS